MRSAAVQSFLASTVRSTPSVQRPPQEHPLTGETSSRDAVNYAKRESRATSGSTQTGGRTAFSSSRMYFVAEPTALLGKSHVDDS